jgi:hypothetical protein
MRVCILCWLTHDSLCLAQGMPIVLHDSWLSLPRAGLVYQLKDMRWAPLGGQAKYKNAVFLESAMLMMAIEDKVANGTHSTHSSLVSSICMCLCSCSCSWKTVSPADLE